MSTAFSPQIPAGEPSAVYCWSEQLFGDPPIVLQRSSDPNWIQAAVAQQMLRGLQDIKAQFAIHANIAWQASQPGVCRHPQRQLSFALLMSCLHITSAQSSYVAHWIVCQILAVLQATPAAIRQFVSDILLKILQKYANPRSQAVALLLIIKNRAKVPPFVAQGCITQVERLHDKHGIPLPTSFTSVLDIPRTEAIHVISGVLDSVPTLQQDASSARCWLELLLSAVKDERPSFIAFLDLFTRCAEDNASVYLLRKVATQAFKSKWQHVDSFHVHWYSTHVVYGMLTQLDLCGVCACGFVPRLHFLLERVFNSA